MFGAALVLAIGAFGMADSVAQAKPPSPVDGTPAWKRMVRIADGRTFVTDGSLAIDVTLARPSPPPAQVLSGGTAKVLEGYLSAQLKDEFGLSELKKSGTPSYYLSPSGVMLNTMYVDYLRRLLPGATLRFRMEGGVNPVIILSNGAVVGVLMPMAR